MENALAYLSSQEKSVLDSFEKVIVWGYPLHSHTQSYLHACWEKTFKALGKDTYWFSDSSFEDPARFSYQKCLFIAEGFQDSKIPLHPSNVYCINFCIYPQKYLRCGARLIEVRFRVNEFHDCNNDWKLDDGTHKLIHLSEDVLYESLSSNCGVAPEFRGPTPTPMTYEAVYMTWPTDLLPWEIRFEDAELPRENVIYHIGTPYPTQRHQKFLDIARAHGIEVKFNDPWSHPIGFEEAKTLVQKSILAPDFRPEGSEQDKLDYGELNGKNHLAVGYIPCRLYKNISYGHIPLTDSPHAFAHFGDAVVYEKDLETLFRKGLEAQKDLERKRRAMKLVQDRHTYLHRARDLLRALLQPRPAQIPTNPSTWQQVTLVTALLDIQREKKDGRKFEDYKQWFEKVLELPAPMVVYVEPSLVEYVAQIRQGKPTKIIPQTIHSAPLSWSLPFIQQIQDSNEWKAFVKNPKDMINISAEYDVVIHSKAPWMWNVIQENPFHTDLFFWIDAGLRRFSTNINVLGFEPHPRLFRTLRKRKCIYTQIGGYKEEYIRRALEGRKYSYDELIGRNENILMAGFWGGTAAPLMQLCEFSMKFFLREFLQKNRIDGEQPVMFFHAQENPNSYLFIPPHDVDYPNFLLFATGAILE